MFRFGGTAVSAACVMFAALGLESARANDAWNKEIKLLDLNQYVCTDDTNKVGNLASS